MRIPRFPELSAAAIRTARADDRAWNETWTALITAYPDTEFNWDGARLVAVERPELAELSVDQVARGLSATAIEQRSLSLTIAS